MSIDEQTAREKAMYETNEQWKGFGICEKCRRRSYCNKDCTAHKQRLEQEMRAFLMRGGIDRLFEKLRANKEDTKE